MIFYLLKIYKKPLLHGKLRVRHNTNHQSRDLSHIKRTYEMPPTPPTNHSAIHESVKTAQYPHNHFQIKAWAAFCVPAAMSGSDQSLFYLADAVSRAMFSGRQQRLYRCRYQGAGWIPLSILCTKRIK